MFLGQFEYTTDSKGRLTIPVRFRAALASGAYLIQGFERNVVVRTSENFQAVAQKAAALGTTRSNARDVRRLIFGHATEAALDSAGRINIPSFLREYAGLDGEVTVVGAGEYFEIWRTEEWKKQARSVTDPEANAKQFADLDL